MTKEPVEWAKATAQLCVRGGVLAVLIFLGVSTETLTSTGATATPELFDLIFTVASAKVFVVGALFSLAASWISGRFGDPTRPTV